MKKRACIVEVLLETTYYKSQNLVGRLVQAFIILVQEQLPSSFHRYSVKMIMEDKGSGHSYGSKTTLAEAISDVTRRGSLWACVNDPKIIWGSTTKRCDLSVVWHIQLDFVDINSLIIHFDSSPGKRRRTLNLLQQAPTRCVEDRSRGSHPPEAKRFKGVRYRPERRTWVAEMKPPKSRNKVSFGDLKSQTQAARAVDAAFHHFGKPLNFADTPQILSALPTSTGLNEEAKLKLVKEQAKWIASIASTLPSTPTSPFTSAAGGIASEPFEISESLTICTTVTSGFRSFFEITSPLSCGCADEADDGVSQPDPMAGFVEMEVETLELSSTAADCGGVVNELEVGQSMFLRGEEDVIVDPCDIAISPDYSTGTLTNFVSFPAEVEQPLKIQRMGSDFLIMSPPAPTLQMISSRTYDGNVADVLLEEHKFIGAAGGRWI